MKALTLRLAIPNRNGAHYLVDALRSINQQDVTVHWWLQDAQSSDESLELARALARSGDTISCEMDQGQSDGVNKAIAHMGGDIIGLLNSDDMLMPGAARRVLEEFQQHPEIDMLVGGVQFIDAEGKPLRQHHGRINSLEEILDLYHVWWKDRHLVQPGVFWRRSLWDKVGPLSTHYHYAFDYEYWLRCFRAGARVRHIEPSLAQFRLHPLQKSNHPNATANELRRILSHALEDPDLKISRFHRWRLNQHLRYDLYQSGSDNTIEAGRPPLWKKLAQNPGWLLVPIVQKRLTRSVRSRLQFVSRKK